MLHGKVKTCHEVNPMQIHFMACFVLAVKCGSSEAIFSRQVRPEPYHTFEEHRVTGAANLQYRIVMV